MRLTLAERAIEVVTLVMFVAVLLATLAQVFFRYVAEIPVPWTEELARTLFVLAMLTGIALAYREREHVVVDFLFLRLPPPARRIVKLVFDAAILILLVIWARGALALAELNWGSTLITLEFFRVAYFYLWELFAIALMVLYVLIDMVKTVRTGAASYGPDTPREAP